MPIVLQHLFAIGGFQGLLLFCLLTVGRSNTKANRVLGFWCLLLGLFFLGILINIQKEITFFSVFIGWNIYLPASFGALLYLYCRQAITDRDFQWSDLLHLLPVLTCYFLNVDTLFASAESKFIWATTPSQGASSFSLTKGVTYLQAFIYLGFSFRMVLHYQRKAKNTLSDFNPEIFKWIWTLLMLTLLVWSFKVVSSSETLYFLSVISDLVIIFLIYGVALAQWRNPKLFIINKIEKINDVYGDKANEAHQLNEKKQTNSALDSSTKTAILVEIKRYMEDKHAFKDNQLNLLSLSELVGVSTHHLSEVLNQHEGKNFYQFVNNYRINYVCEQLKKDQKCKIIDLALASGFSSKSTFNAVFKQFMGVSPTQYRNTMKHSSK